MGQVLMSGGAGGLTSGDVTTVLAHVLAGETALTSDSGDEPGVGTMTVNSLLSFNVAAYSGRRVLATWQNPYAAAGRPYSGVYIRYSTSGYPGKTGGTQIYKGAGSNTSAGGQSQVYLDLPNLNTTYYFSIFPYVTTSLGDLLGEALNANAKTAAELWLTFTYGQNYSVPAGFSKARCFAVGGGAGGGRNKNLGSTSLSQLGGGGGSGYAGTSGEFAISAEQNLAIIVGAGGVAGANGGTSGISGIFTKGGGNTPVQTSIKALNSGGNGGSGGGAIGPDLGSSYSGGNGGSDGGNGQYFGMSGINPGYGQGSTTRAWGNGTLFSGAGGGAGNANDTGGGLGGSGGGGRGAFYGSYAAGNGSANTGSAGGGGIYKGSGAVDKAAGSGGSGIVLLHLY